MTPLEELAQGMAHFGECTQVLIEWGNGIKASLQRDGWSPTVAEHMASEMILAMFRKVTAP